MILALPQDAAQSLVSRLGYSAAVVPAATIGDAGFQQQGVKNVRPALLLSTTPGTEVRNARPVTAIGTLHMVSSSKVFGSIARSAADGTEVPSFGGDKIRAVVSDCGLAASYVVPSTTFPENYYSFLTSYTWDDDSTRLQHALGRWPRNAENETTGTMFNFMINRATRLVRDIDGADKPWWFGQLLGKVDATDKVSYDWTTNSSAGGFKLDSTGDHYQSNFCVRYHTHALDAKLDSRFFLASCSYSHLGGWLEGAFMSAVNAVTGIVTAANKGDVSKLNDEARKLMTNLDPVILVPKPAETLHSKSSHLETV